MAKKKEQKQVSITSEDIVVEKEITLGIDWNVSPNIITRFATNMVVQKLENEFKILFFEIKPPIAISPEDVKKMKEQGSVMADCIGSFIITAERLPKFIEILNKQLTNYLELKEKKALS